MTPADALILALLLAAAVAALVTVTRTRPGCAVDAWYGPGRHTHHHTHGGTAC